MSGASSVARWGFSTAPSEASPRIGPLMTGCRTRCASQAQHLARVHFSVGHSRLQLCRRLPWRSSGPLGQRRGEDRRTGPHGPRRARFCPKGCYGRQDPWGTRRPTGYRPFAAGAGRDRRLTRRGVATFDAGCFGAEGGCVYDARGGPRPAPHRLRNARVDAHQDRPHQRRAHSFRPQIPFSGCCGSQGEAPPFG